jgi:hypothetical protein
MKSAKSSVYSFFSFEFRSSPTGLHTLQKLIREFGLGTSAVGFGANQYGRDP